MVAERITEPGIASLVVSIFMYVIDLLMDDLILGLYNGCIKHIRLIS